MRKKYLQKDVLEAATERVSWAFEEFDRVCVSFSGGKDSTCLLHLAAAEARKRGRRLGCLFVDWEAQYRATIDHVASMFEEYADIIDPYWVALPLTTSSGVSSIEPTWTCWDPKKEYLWVRPKPEWAVSDPSRFPFYTSDMTFEEFMPAFGEWYGNGSSSAHLIGIRTDESINRLTAITRSDKATHGGKHFTTAAGSAVNVYPIYDWRVSDVWTYLCKFRLGYNKIYDLMYNAGVSLPAMRICEPYGVDQRKGLKMFHALEPETWVRVSERVAGANTGALYASSNKQGPLGNGTPNLPPTMGSWRDYCKFLLDTIPELTAEHYRNKFANYLQFYHKKGAYLGGSIPDFQANDCGSRDVPSWRRFCKTILKNDFWCEGLSYSPTKSESYGKYSERMRKKREEWKII